MNLRLYPKTFRECKYLYILSSKKSRPLHCTSISIRLLNAHDTRPLYMFTSRTVFCTVWLILKLASICLLTLFYLSRRKPGPIILSRFVYPSWRRRRRLSSSDKTDDTTTSSSSFAAMLTTVSVYRQKRPLPKSFLPLQSRHDGVVSGRTPATVFFFFGNDLS